MIQFHLSLILKKIFPLMLIFDLRILRGRCFRHGFVSCFHVYLQILFVIGATLFIPTIVLGQPPNAPQLQGIREKYNISDKMLSLFDNSPPRSSWLESEKNVYKTLLNQTKFDVLVVPVQTKDHTVDLTSRKLMSYRLMVEIENRTDLSVAPLHLVYRALGNSSRNYEDEEVYQLANSLGVSQIIWGFAGYTFNNDKKSLFNFSLLKQEGKLLSETSASEYKNWPNIPLGYRTLPIQAFEGRISYIMNFLGFPDPTKANLIYSYLENLDIPPKPIDLIKNEEENPIIQAHYLQLLGLLIPSASGEIKRDFFIRSLSFLWRADPSSPEYNVLMARAFLYLSRRPLSIKYLEATETPEGKALYEYANANLPEMEIPISQITSPLKKIIAELEIFNLENSYVKQKNEPDFSGFVGKYPSDWEYFLIRKLQDQDGWAPQNNIYLKVLLDYEFPVDGMTMESLYKAAVASGELEQRLGDFNLLFLEHIWKAILSNNESSQLSNNDLNKYDYLLLLEAIGESNLLNAISFEKDIQGQRDRANNIIDECLKVYNGHPVFSSMKATILYSIYLNTKFPTQKEKENIVNEIKTNGLVGIWWTGRQTTMTRHIAKVLSYFEKKGLLQINQSKNNKFPLLAIKKELEKDFPPAISYLNDTRLLEREEKYAWPFANMSVLTKDFEFFQKITGDPVRNEKRINKILNAIENRFHGNPNRTALQAEIFNYFGELEKTKKLYSEARHVNPLNWENYLSLGELYVYEGNYEKAKEIFMSYPLFSDLGKEYNSVGISNDAYIAGSLLFWHGAYQQAKPLYELSAQLETGSSGSISSQIRLFLLERDFVNAAEYSLYRGKRYKDHYAFRDYLSLLHLLDQSDMAWPLFDSLLGRFRTPQIWTSAFVGHRLNGLDKKQQQNWLRDKVKLSRASHQKGFFARFALMNFIDREPEMDDAIFVESLDYLSGYKVVGNRLINSIGQTIGSSPKRKKAPANKNGAAIISFYGEFAKAYILLKKGSYEESFQVFKNISEHFHYLWTSEAQMTPYYVWAGLKSGKTMQVRKLLESNKIKDDKFDGSLARAVLKGLQGEHQEAIKNIKTAFAHRPYTESRFFFSWYQIVELCEWLYKESNEKRYIEIGLKWARDYQKIQPMFAWAYAFEAKYTEDPERRLRALAFAQYLDRQSSYISHVSSSEKEKARAWMKNNNPFGPEPAPVMDSI